MCGRFAQPRSSDDLARIFRARPAAELAGERYNVAPTDEVAAVVQHHGDRQVDVFRWGLLPIWAKSRRDGARMINTRAETISSSPAYRTALRRRRCIIPADAFYEWRRPPGDDGGRSRRGRSEPFAIRRRSSDVLAMAGLWAVWREPETAERVYTCTIVTTVANEVMSGLHDRMPVILDADGWPTWLDERTPADDLLSLLVPAPAEEFEAYAVSPAVSNVRSEGPGLLDPLSRWADGTSGAAAHAGTIWTEPA
jgi:putative SOS response-associated peptidase YedK